MSYRNRFTALKPWYVLLSMSLLYAASIGIVYNVIGVFYSPASEGLGVLRGSFALHTTITSIVAGVISLITPQFIERFKWKPTLLFSIITAVVGTSGLAFTDSMAIIYVLGAIRGIGVGLMGQVPIPLIINNWFYEKKGLAISIATVFGGVAGVVLSPIFSSLISAIGWQRSFFVLGLVILGLSLPALLMPYEFDPQDEGAVPYGGLNGQPEPQIAAHHFDEKSAPKDAKQYHGIFITLMLFTFIQISIMSINQHFPGYGETVGMTLAASGFLISAVMIGNIVSKFGIGVLSDKFGTISATMLMSIFTLISIVMLVIVPVPQIMLISSVFFGACFGVLPVAIPLLIRDFFPPAMIARVLAVSIFARNIGSAFSNTIIGYIYDFFGSYVPAFWLIGFFQLLNIMLLVYLFKKQKQLNN